MNSPEITELVIKVGGGSRSRRAIQAGRTRKAGRLQARQAAADAEVPGHLREGGLNRQ